MKPVISISGLAGSGKTTCALAIARDFGLKYFSTGKIFRELAEKYGMSLAEFSHLAEKEDTIDRKIDEAAKKAAEEGYVVLDGRLTGWFCRHVPSLKIWLKAPLEVRVERIAERDHIPFEEAKIKTLMREKSEIKRYEKYYGINLNDLSIYDLILDTSLYSKKSMLKIVRFAVKEYMIQLVGEEHASNRNRKNLH